MKSDFRSKEMGEVLPEGLKEKKKLTESLGNEVRVFQLWPSISAIFQIHIYFNILIFLLVCEVLLTPPQPAVPEEKFSGAGDRLRQLLEESFPLTKVN